MATTEENNGSDLEIPSIDETERNSPPAISDDDLPALSSGALPSPTESASPVLNGETESSLNDGLPVLGNETFQSSEEAVQAADDENTQDPSSSRDVTLQPPEEEDSLVVVTSQENQDDPDQTITPDQNNGAPEDGTNPDEEDNESPDSEIIASNIDDGVSDVAHDVVKNVIETASSSLRSCGDFSLLKDHFEVDEDLLNQDKLDLSEFHLLQDDSMPFSDRDEKPSLEDFSLLEPEATFENEMPAESENKKSKEVVEEKEEEEWLDILGNNLLRKKVLVPGQGQTTRPERSQEVTINIESSLDDGSVLEESRTVKFVVGDLDMAEAVDMSVNLMEKGEKCQVVSDVRFCQPKDGRLIEIPPKGSIHYIIELIEIDDGPYNSSVSVEKRLSWVLEKKNLGNAFYSQDKTEEAKHTYQKCTKVLMQASAEEQNDEVTAQIKDLSLKCHCNLAAALMKMQDWKEALKAILEAEQFNPLSIKVLYRKGTIQSKLGHHVEAVNAFKKALTVEPNDRILLMELNTMQKRLAKENEEQKKLYRRMFQYQADPIKPATTSKANGWFSPSVLFGSSLAVLGSAVLFGIYMRYR